MRQTVLFFLVVIATLCHASDHDNYIQSDLFGGMKATEKGAVLMVHFGTTYDDTRALTIDAINQQVKEAFEGIEVFTAFTSRIVIRRLKARGIDISTPGEMLDQLQREGYTHVLIQSSNIIDGAEMESLRHEVENYSGKFADIRLGNALLYSPEDYETVIEAISKRTRDRQSVLLVGHGTYTPATASYAMMDYMLKAKGLTNYHVGTIEGYPTFDTAEQQIKASGAKEVLLVPFMFVAGDHANNDIAVEWKEELEQRGYQVEVLMEGLGQNPDIQKLIIEHARFAATHKNIGIMSKKAQYASEND